MQALVNRLWYNRQAGVHWLLVLLLLPLSGLFYLLTSLRRQLFRLGLKSSARLDVPVIVVGNITVGGSGKTPTVIYLIELLRHNGYRPGVISRGYGVEFSGCKRVIAGMPASEVGDEPAMIVARTQVPMVIGRNRVAAGKALREWQAVDVIISDDGLQHYRLERDIEILVLDGKRRFGNGLLLPAGPLREGRWRQRTVDFTLVNGESAHPEEFEMALAPGNWRSVADGELVSANLTESPADNPLSENVAIAGIGNPQRFFDTLTHIGVHPVHQHAFDDHQAYSLEAIETVAAGRGVLMTEKDAVKCREFAKSNWCYLPVDAKIAPEFEQQLLTLLRRRENVQQGN
ncbi:tetraacyldisaccharide 4'-kinase [Shewanella insulae]|uniref:tetraacyldisaccharide 4'-kinase n=1 Tax=Shewanella insulae TaxID=2681496 RepID=UPI001EFC9E4F|nr:tetraacyldisaccharide 4'-kinase [Shewanella insulae]MCG9711725.1 tetraacyldisaccharide 4'-kinase [Shewanella insulae]MCG9756025.1 tetraacyldisaccharide 4'-kinase [Shewanella insulae]